jgi:LmbE family N-acetylglucosaminyl deacetylase
MASIVFFHAHPDDEAILTAGTMRGLTKNGHEVHLVVATRGEAGLADAPNSRLGKIRIGELQEAAVALGVDDVSWLGYCDSGLDGKNSGDRETFCRADVDDAAERLADFCRSVNATTLIGYDEKGGYGHPDHVQVHKVASRAAELLQIDHFLEATVDQAKVRRIVNLLGFIPRLMGKPEALEVRNMFTPTAKIGLTIDITEYLHDKRESMKAHSSQHSGGDQLRTLKAFSSIPEFIFRSWFKYEWYVVRWERNSSNPLRDL